MKIKDKSPAKTGRGRGRPAKGKEVVKEVAKEESKEEDDEDVMEVVEEVVEETGELHPWKRGVNGMVTND